MFEPIETLNHDEKPVPVITTAVEIPGEDIVLQRYIPEINWKNATSHPVSSTVNEIFRKHALERPDAPAVCAWDAGRAFRWRGPRTPPAGVKPEVLSALLFEKSKVVTVALHAVLQAGGAFVLLDPSLPVGRLQAIFAESRAQMIISSAATAGIAAEISADSMIVDDQQIPHPSTESSDGLVNQPENALYSVFTSGSTGTPKGFLMEHRALVTCALACGQSLGLNKNSRTLQFSSNSFDLATFEHLIPFIFGACICIPSEEERKGDLTKALHKYQITLAMLTPSVSRLLEPEHLPILKTVMLCGEPVLSEDVRRWSSYVHLHNGYSPAEAGCITIMNEAMNEADPNNIGYSLGITPWVVHPDNYDQLLEVGEVGELIIQGHTVGRGYFGPRKESQSTFIDAPAWVGDFIRESYGSFYKTGDLVQFNMDGSMQFLGRKDSQVKLHGQRLELGEIEHQLRQYFPPPHAMIVELVTAENREPNLIAFVSRSQDMTSMVAHDNLFLVPDEQFIADARRAEGTLREKLPAYMVPSDFLLLSHLPMMPSGKTDRRSIRTMAANLAPMERRKYSSMLATSQGQPSTKLEESLVHLWASSLNIPIDQIGTQDNYFSLGGTSLDAIRLSASARKLGYAGLSSVMVFKHPTIQLMAGMLEGAIKQPISNMPSSVSFQLNSTVTDHLLAKCQLQANELEGGFLPTTAFQQKSAGLKCMHITLDTSGLDHSRLEAAWEAVQKKHISLRSVYITHDGCVYQAFLRQPETAISIQYCDDQPIKEVTASFCDRDAEPVLNGSRWWKLTRIIQKRDSSSLLIIRTTHAQFDAMTLNVIFKDFMAAFEGRELSQCELHFSDYMTSRVKQNLSSPVMDFWTQFLHGSQMSQPLFTDASSADLLPDHIGMVFVMRPITPTPILPVGITLASVFRAAWAFVLGNYTGQHDLVFGEFVEGRTLPLVQDVESITGCTAAETPMRITIPHHEGATVQDLLSHSQAQYATRLPFETCELPDIVPHCVPSWPVETTRFSHLLVLENTEAIPPVIVDGQVCAHNWAFHGRLEDVQVQLVPGKDTLHVAILGPEIRLSQDIADMLVDKLATTLGQFVSMPDALISKIKW
ncbi:Nonribosomal peptide synthase [Penicillium atrosanguineum]|uniref:Nonribosomal peptide synthase n=1 Tax=Penicillium atrosanguineum TaxID=1132637 RepID=A0A9W9U976_9EURO|nr:Nonribosomal peptide synthase [Penicillium atrosanguineum]